MAKRYEFTYFLKEKLYDVTDSIDGSLGSEELDENDIILEDEVNNLKRKLPSVKYADVSKIGYEIALNFKAKKLPIENVEKV